MIITRENRRTGRRICLCATFSTINVIQAGRESSLNLRGDSQATNPPEPWSGPPFVLHLANLYWQTSCVDNRYDIHICTACPDVAATRGGKTCFPNWHLPSHVSYIRPNLPFRRNSFLRDSCLQLSIALAQRSPPHKQPEGPGSRNGQVMCLIS
jgi:hypothetical protein